ncbi:MAG: hypothetical protein KF764_19165 [Labilithrix sp.]|nr:hypothetical protein [Labilithrix sp.]MBX3222473.1 hypothetical protein [Labilithrix sp.]
MDRPELDKRCGSCARFVRVIETFDENGEVKRKGECLLMVWPPPLYEHNTCSQYVKRGTFTGKPVPKARVARTPRTSPRAAARPGEPRVPFTFELPEELLDMNADEFREVLREVIRDELGVAEVELGGRWQGGEVVLKPGKEGTQEKRIPIEALFAKIVMIRDRLRVLEQKINGNGKLSAEEKVQMQQYVTGCYGSLTTFNVLFAEKGDQFVGQKGDD